MMNVEQIILYLIGGGCVYYLVRKVLHTMKGESGCSSCSGYSSEKKSCCGNQPPEGSDEQ